VSVNALTPAGAKNLMLQKLYERVQEDKPRFITVSYLSALCAENLTNQYAEVIVADLEAENFVVRGDSSAAQKGRISISAHGIDFIRSNRRFSEYPELDQQTWKQNDSGQALGSAIIGKVNYHLSQCVILINGSDFSQEDKAQIAGLLRICQQIMDLPEPKVGLLRRILGWLKEIKDLAPLIELIFKLIGKA